MVTVQIVVCTTTSGSRGAARTGQPTPQETGQATVQISLPGPANLSLRESAEIEQFIRTSVRVAH